MAVNINNSNAGTLTLSPPASGGGYTLTLPATAGTVGQGLTVDGSGNLSFGSAGLTGFTTAINSTGTNASRYVNSITASGGSTNQHFALDVYSNTSSIIMLDIPDGAATGGNARGSSAVDFTLARSGASYVASGAFSLCVGYIASAGDYAINFGGSTASIANAASSSASSKIAISPINFNSPAPTNFEASLNTVTNLYDSAAYPLRGNFNFISTGEYLGNTSSALHLFSCRALSSTANSQIATRRIIFGTTTGASTTVLTADGATLTANNSLGTDSNYTAQMLEIRYIGVEETANSTTTPTNYIVGWTQIFATKAAGAATQTATSTFNGVVAAGGTGSGWGANVAANTTIGCPTFSVTGSGGVVRWMAFVMTAEVSAQA